MTPTPPPVPATVPGFVVLDLDLPERPPLVEAGDYEAGLLALAAVQESSTTSSTPTARAATASGSR
jgi:hypothetical protein